MVERAFADGNLEQPSQVVVVIFEGVVASLPATQPQATVVRRLNRGSASTGFFARP